MLVKSLLEKGGIGGRSEYRGKRSGLAQICIFFFSLLFT